MHRHRHFRKFFESAGNDFGGRFFGPGEIRLAILSLLAEKPSHGYEVMTRLEERSGGTYQASAGAIYPTLQQLEDQGLIQSKQVDGKKVFELTDEGRKELDAHSEGVGRIWQRADAWSDWGDVRNIDAAEIIPSAMRLAKAAMKTAARSHGDPAVIKQVREILEKACQDIEAIRRVKSV
jgi:DNA-binding PadR family transcriptional regulator